MVLRANTDLCWFERLPKVELHVHLEGAIPVDRIGHGTRAIEDPVLVDYLAENQVPLELCVLSNVRTAVIADVSEHPARSYHDRGIPLSINTDDPTLFGNTLAEEYFSLHQHLDFSRAEILRLIEQGIQSSWRPPERKRELLAKFRTEFLTLEHGDA